MAGIEGVFRALDISGSALSAQRFNMEVISANLAYADIDSTNDGQPYRRREVRFETVLDSSLGRSHATPFLGVRARVHVNSRRGPLVKAPEGMAHGVGGVDANGWIEKSNVDVSQEMVHLLEASRAYEANIAAVKAFREMVNRALSIGR